MPPLSQGGRGILLSTEILFGDKQFIRDLESVLVVALDLLQAGSDGGDDICFVFKASHCMNNAVKEVGKFFGKLLGVIQEPLGQRVLEIITDKSPYLLRRN